MIQQVHNFSIQNTISAYEVNACFDTLRIGLVNFEVEKHKLFLKSY